MTTDSKYSWEDLLALLMLLVLAALFGATIVGQFTTTAPIPQVAAVFAALVGISRRDNIGKIDLLLSRRIVYVVGLVTVLSSYFVGMIATHSLTGVDASVYLKNGLQTLPTHLFSLAALLLTLRFHYKVGDVNLRPRLYIYRRGAYKKVIGPTSLMKSIKGLGGYLVIGDKIEIASGVYFSGTNAVASNAVNGVTVGEMETAELDTVDKTKLGL